MTTECYVLGCTNPSTTARVCHLNGHLFLSIPTLLCDHHACKLQLTERIYKDFTLEEYEVLKVKDKL